MANVSIPWPVLVMEGLRLLLSPSESIMYTCFGCNVAALAVRKVTVDDASNGKWPQSEPVSLLCGSIHQLSR